MRTPKIVQMPDILGEVIDEKMNGEIAFEFAGQKLKLLVTEEPDHRLLIQFKDLTNGKTTFQATRYLYTDPHQDGKVFVDFNKAYNPPCSFTDYATCSCRCRAKIIWMWPSKRAKLVQDTIRFHRKENKTATL